MREADGIRCVGLLRGVNVGKAKRVPMAELRAVVTALGLRDVRTLLNSGNVVFTATPARAARAAPALERAIAGRFGFPVPTIVLTAAEMDDVVRDNPFADAVEDHSRLLVAFVADPGALGLLASLAAGDSGTSRLAVGERAAYLWCPDGVLQSPLPEAVGRLLKGTVTTTRNWATTRKLHALLQES